jgi:hypothetical protein
MIWDKNRGWLEHLKRHGFREIGRVTHVRMLGKRFFRYSGFREDGTPRPEGFCV